MCVRCMVKKVLPKHSIVIFGCVHAPPWQNLRSQYIVAQTLSSLLKIYVNTKKKFPVYVQSEVTGFQSKEYQDVSRMPLAL